MLVTTYVVQFPSQELAKQHDKDYMAHMKKIDPNHVYKDTDFFICEHMALQLINLMEQIRIMHIVCVFITLYRETNDSNMEFIGQIMRGGEIMGIILHLGIILQCQYFMTTWI